MCSLFWWVHHTTMYTTRAIQEFFFCCFFTGRWLPSWCWCDPTLESSLSPQSPCHPTWRILWPSLIRSMGETKTKATCKWDVPPGCLEAVASGGHTDLCPCQTWLCCPRRQPRQELAAGERGRETLLLTAETDGPPKGDDRSVKWKFELLKSQEESRSRAEVRRQWILCWPHVWDFLEG